MLRPITPADDAAVADLIRDVMTEYGAGGPGFAIHDPEVGRMSGAYPGGRAQYLVVEWNGEVAGGGGFGPLAGMPADTEVCELRKMYFRPPLRGRGLGRRLLGDLLERMRGAGFRRCYLETTSRMREAQQLYRKLGFRQLEGPMGGTGHHGCNTFYLRDL